MFSQVMNRFTGIEAHGLASLSRSRLGSPALVTWLDRAHMAARNKRTYIDQKPYVAREILNGLVTLLIAKRISYSSAPTHDGTRRSRHKPLQRPIEDLRKTHKLQRFDLPPARFDLGDRSPIQPHGVSKMVLTQATGPTSLRHAPTDFKQSLIFRHSAIIAHTLATST
ncbi:hypothetical protein GCM10009555_013290 [Acrocarpospora macrocephala]|uniref:Uncharacterized protein n=1 Tax=Acrocarpospora macrocephala TaxID=150177 RepID=A0A5M3WPI0_9ACTN|nr:hypothetical protein Amac_017330 [Acrocarpospora macrocephala]